MRKHREKTQNSNEHNAMKEEQKRRRKKEEEEGGEVKDPVVQTEEATPAGTSKATEVKLKNP